MPEIIRDAIEQFRNKLSRSGVVSVRADKAGDVPEGFQRNVVATENPVVVWDWYRWEPIREILLMDGAVLPENRQLPLLDNHSRYSTAVQMGSTRDLRIDGKELIGNTRISRSPAVEHQRILVEDGDLTDTSVGYEVYDKESIILKPGESTDYKGRKFKNDFGDEFPLAIRTKWRPFENSLTPVGADQASKFRSMFAPKPEAKPEPADEAPVAAQEREQVEINLQGNLEEQINKISERSNLEIKIIKQNPMGDTMPELNLKDALARERARVDAILAEANSEDLKRQLPGVDLIKESEAFRNDESKTIADYHSHLVRLMKEKTPSRTPDTHLGLTDQEVQDYSMRKIILAQLNRDYRDVGLEMEASRALAQKLNKEPLGVFIPDEVQQRRRSLNLSKLTRNERDLVVGTPASGGYTVQNQYIPQSFVEMFEQALTFFDGNNFITGLRGNVPMTRELTGADYYWGGEGDDITLSSGPTFGQETKTPHKLGSRIKESYEFLTQTSLAIDVYIEKKLARAAARGFNRGIGYGTGTNDQITGLKLISGVGSQVGTSFTRSKALTMESQVLASGAPGTPKWFARAATRAILKDRKIDEGSGLFLVNDRNEMLGYDFKGISQELDAGDLFYGVWSELLLMYWNQLDILANPFGDGYAAGDVQVRALVGVDMFCNHPDSFSIAEEVS